VVDEAVDEALEKAARALRQTSFLAVLTGSGVSAESGIPTFRGADGLWQKYRAEELATPQAFARNPTLVWEFYDWRRQLISRAQPNAAHLTIAMMEKRCGEFMLVTQNVDGLHSVAGSRRLIELHGNIWRMRCLQEGKTVENREVPLKEIPPRCSCGGLMRPDVVWFGEALSHSNVEAAFRCARQCDVMLVVGTSGVVQPAASLPVVAKQKGACIIEVNLEETPISRLADFAFYEKACAALPRLYRAAWE